MNGIINLNKPQNHTSHDCVAIMRRLTGIKKIGHTGTLDPMAEGVLPICIGRATRIMEYLDIDFKTYRCTLKLGLSTDTLDIWGKTLETKKITADEEEIKNAFSCFQGEIEQIPPKYSALKVNGKKLYEYARAGEDVEIKSRKVIIKNLVIENISEDEITFVVTCSKGTYIRSICNDIGNMLGCGGVMSKLTRIASGVFTIDNSISLELLKHMTREEIEEKLLPIEYPLTSFGKAKLSFTFAKNFIDGKHIEINNVDIVKKSSYKEMYNFYLEDKFLGVAYYSDKYKKFVADKVFNTEI